MPLPAFSKSGHPLGTLTFSKSYIFPFEELHEANQVVSYSFGGSSNTPRAIKVVDFGGIEKTINLVFTDLAVTEARSIRDWLEHGAIGYALENFIFTDAQSVTRTVRYMGGKFSERQTSYGIVGNVEMTLRVED